MKGSNLCQENSTGPQLPLTERGYFSVPSNFDHFSACAETYFELAPGENLSPSTNEMFRSWFQLATPLGVFKRGPRKWNWKQVLWALSVHWGVQECPCPFDEFGDCPDSLDIFSIAHRLQTEARTLEETQVLASQKDSLAPEDPPSCSESDEENSLEDPQPTPSGLPLAAEGFFCQFRELCQLWCQFLLLCKL